MTCEIELTNSDKTALVNDCDGDLSRFDWYLDDDGHAATLTPWGSVRLEEVVMTRSHPTYRHPVAELLLFEAQLDELIDACGGNLIKAGKYLTLLRNNGEEEYSARHPDDKRTLSERVDQAREDDESGRISIEDQRCPHCGLVPELKARAAQRAHEAEEARR